MTVGKVSKNTLLRVIPTMTFIHFLTGILSDMSFFLAFYLTYLLAFYLSGKSSGISSGILSGISSSISCGVLSGILLAYVLANLLAFFFPSSARWLSPGRLSSRKDNCIVQIHRITAVATSVITTM